MNIVKNSKINDIARLAGVSNCTVSRVFNNRPYVKDEIRQKILDIAVKMDYRPKMTVRKDVVTILIGSLHDLSIDNYETALISSLFNSGVNHNLSIELLTLDEMDRIYQNFSKTVIGLVYGDESVEKLCRIKNIPILMVNYAGSKCSSVCTDHYGGIFDAVEYLIGNGHERIGMLFSPFEESVSWGDKARLNAYKDALSRHNIKFTRELCAYGVRTQMDAIGKMLITQKPTALIACGESLALPVKYALDLFNKRIPDDISLITFYSPGVTPYLLPEMTCIRQNFKVLADTVMDKLVDLVSGKTERTEIVIPNDFIPGSSVKTIN